MTIPSVMFIEAGADSLPTLDPATKQAQIKELVSFGDERAKRLGATGLTGDFSIGYQLGIETARAMQSMGAKL